VRLNRDDLRALRWRRGRWAARSLFCHLLSVPWVGRFGFLFGCTRPSAPRPAAPAAAVAFRSMDSAVTTGAFALGGVVVGGGLDWLRASIAGRRAAAGERDQLVAALDAACIGLMTEALTWRTLDTPGSKLKQLAFGMMEAGLPEPRDPASVTDVAYTLVKWLGTGASKRLQHQTPVALADNIRRTLMPLRTEIAVLAVRLSMTGDEGIKAATLRVGDAAGALLEHITEPDPQYGKRQEEMQAAIGQLRRARDAADAHWWRRRKLRRRIRPGAGVSKGG
jgi:hypothetical protein